MVVVADVLFVYSIPWDDLWLSIIEL